MTTEQVRDLIAGLLNDKRYEQINTGAEPRIEAIAHGTGSIAVTFTDGTRHLIAVLTEGEPS